MKQREEKERKNIKEKGRKEEKISEEDRIQRNRTDYNVAYSCMTCKDKSEVTLHVIQIIILLLSHLQTQPLWHLLTLVCHWHSALPQPMMTDHYRFLLLVLWGREWCINKVRRNQCSYQEFALGGPIINSWLVPGVYVLIPDQSLKQNQHGTKIIIKLEYCNSSYMSTVFWYKVKSCNYAFKETEYKYFNFVRKCYSFFYFLGIENSSPNWWPLWQF